MSRCAPPQPFLPPMPRPGPEDPGQYSFGDRARVERILTEAGFAAPGIEPIDRPIWTGHTAADGGENIGRFGPLARAFADVEPAAIEKAKDGDRRGAAPQRDPTAYAARGWLVQLRPGACSARSTALIAS